jgi:hypothetical protein
VVEKEGPEAPLKIRLERLRAVLGKPGLHSVKALERFISAGELTGRILRNGKAREDLEMTAGVLEGQETRDAQIPRGERVVPGTVCRHAGPEEPDLEVRLAARRVGGEQEAQQRSPAPRLPREHPSQALPHHLRRPFPSNLRTRGFEPGPVAGTPAPAAG